MFAESRVLGANILVEPLLHALENVGQAKLPALVQLAEELTSSDREEVDGVRGRGQEYDIVR